MKRIVNMAKYKAHIIWLVIAILAFAGGMYYGSSRAPAAGGGRFGFNASSTRGFGGRSGAGGGFAMGQIVSVDPQSITVQLPSGSSEIVFYSTSTQIIKPSPASASDLTPGTTILVGGSTNSDGSVTAQTIQIRQGMPGGQ